MSEYFGRITDLPTVTEGHFIPNSEKRVVFGPNGRFMDDYVMRCFTLNPGSGSASHAHKWCHWAVCIGGEGKFKVGEETAELECGVWVHVPGGVPHNFWNTSETEQMTLLCIVPTEGDVNPLLMMGC